MYIDFDDYPSYSSALSENFETDINAHILCDKGYAYSTIKDNMLTWISKEIQEIMKICFPKAKQVKISQNNSKKGNGSFDFLPDNEHTFSTSYFHENPLLDV